jgi:serine/threonine-protein kinase
MDPERWRRIKEVFTTVLNLPVEQRASWLSAALPDDPTLVCEVEGLLAAHDGADDFYDRGALAALPEMQRTLERVEGMRIGPYRVLSELGRGGMGAVYLAVRDQPGFTQKVALKLIKRGMDTDEIVRRFLAERQILASLTHPNIARLFDGGSTPDGRPYFVMEYVQGQSITAYTEKNKLSLEDRLQLFLRVCRAVQHAHQRLVVHRDLKPPNILVDAEGEPKLLDFGIAKLLDPSSFAGVTVSTGLVPGPMTPEYASPEQLAGQPVTTATDVYSLGLLLYELLTGQRASLRKGEPSHFLAASEDPEKRRLARRVAGDLDTILNKALEEEPEQRYGTAAALAEDIERHLTQRPVTARRPTLAYRMGRALVRHKLAAALGIAAFLIVAIASYALFAVSQESSRAEAQRQSAQALDEFLQRTLQKASPEQNLGETLTIRQTLDAGNQELLSQGSQYPPGTRAALLETTGKIYRSLGLYEQAQKNLQRARELREPSATSREGDLALAGTLTALGNVCLDQADFAESRTFFQRALALKERQLGSTALDLAPDLNGLGTAFLEEGKLDEAGRNFDRACEISRSVEGRPRDLAECYNNLGALAERREKYKRARVLFSLAFHYFQATVGEEHPDTMQVRANLAAFLNAVGDYAGAEELFQQIVDVRRRLLKPNHPDLAKSLLNLAIVQRAGRRFREAQATLNELLEMRRSYKFPHDQSEAETWNLQGALAIDVNDLEAADAAYVKSYEIYRALPGDQRGNLSNVLIGRASIRLLRDDPADALGFARRSLDLAEASDVRSGDAVARAEILLGRCYLALGQSAQARPLLEHSHETLLALYGPEHPTTREAAVYLRRLSSPAD